MDHAHKKLENGTQSFYDRVPRQTNRLHVNLALTQKLGQAQNIAIFKLQQVPLTTRGIVYLGQPLF